MTISYHNSILNDNYYTTHPRFCGLFAINNNKFITFSYMLNLFLTWPHTTINVYHHVTTSEYWKYFYTYICIFKMDLFFFTLIFSADIGIKRAKSFNYRTTLLKCRNFPRLYILKNKFALLVNGLVTVWVNFLVCVCLVKKIAHSLCLRNATMYFYCNRH